MDQAKGVILLNDLKNDSLKFYNEGKSYDLLQEFLNGFPTDILQKLLHNKDKWVKRVAIWIVSELGTIGENFIKDVNELINDEDNYICSYALEIIANCARNNYMEDFKNIFLSLDHENPEIKISVMHIISNLSESRINDAFIYMASSVNSDDGHIKGLEALLNFNNLSESEIDDMNKNDNPIIKKYGLIIAKKLFKKFPDFIGKFSKSEDYVICKFSKQVLETEKIFNEFMSN